MPIGKTLCTLVAAMTISGCNLSTPKCPEEEVLNGIPISSVTHIFSSGIKNTLSVMVQRSDGKIVLCEINNQRSYISDSLTGDRYIGDWSNEKTLKAQTIIRSEINDKDDESVSLKGIYSEGIFWFTYVSANGYDVDTKIRW